jgi:hypothetical protein
MARFVVEFTTVIPHSGGEEYRDPILGFGLHVIASDTDSAEHEGSDTAYLEARAVPYDPTKHGEWAGEDDWLAEDAAEVEGETGADIEGDLAGESEG